MELELATLEDMIAELRRRRLRFLFAAVEPSNHLAQTSLICAAQGKSRQELLPLIWQLRKIFSVQRDSDRGL